MATKRKIHRLGNEDAPVHKCLSDRDAKWLASFACAIISGTGELNPKDVMNRAEKMLQELHERIM